jgi:thymidylate synthase (FAD)
MFGLKFSVQERMMKTKLKWITPDADKMIAHMARVSNPNAKEDDSSEKLIKYLIDHKHWSPFEMACMCVEIETTRDVSHQILRHRSFHFQEFSQRYSEVPQEPEFSKPVRLQDPVNRQNSIVFNDEYTNGVWERIQTQIWEKTHEMYKFALEQGVAKELARKLLPEGLTTTRLYMQGTIRDWIHYILIRSSPETQLEHRLIAEGIEDIMKISLPLIMKCIR